MSYVYRGTGTDTLTGEMTPEDILRDITRHEGKGWKLPLRASEVVLLHGTTTGYEQHKTRGQEPCESCKQAERLRWQDWKQRQRSKP